MHGENNAAWPSSAGSWPSGSSGSSSAGWTASATAAAASPSPTVPYASDSPNSHLWNENSPIVPEAIRNTTGATILGPQNLPIDLQNADFLAPPTTDGGSEIPSLKWPFSLSAMRLQTGGWVRVENKISAANFRLDAGAIRELHWHSIGEWSYVISGYTQITAVDGLGRNYVGTAGPGDLWYFPAGVGHSLQATNQTADGSEFMLIFDNGQLSPEMTFLVNWTAHTPKEAIARNFGTSLAAFDNIPSHELYILPADPPTTNTAPEDPFGQMPNPLVWPLSQIEATPLAGGNIKIVDSTTFKASTTIAAAVVEVVPGGMSVALSSLHAIFQWHPNSDEWDFFLEGCARMTAYVGDANARTFDFQPGDVGYVPSNWGHYIENIGNTTMKYLEIFKAGQFEDISLTQWLAMTPPSVVQSVLGISPATIAAFNGTKQYVVGPPPQPV
ncbi:oxalate decarboxylase [Boletus edulis BED1]|uniref:Oxalate decarboxylase n=1 Tax=Boletus edulis BED1 TaxID=1328754 RepID=A0AAD4BWR7_BOLED|nr:oxalate decarboxylase [Boletus edulis BED1]